MFLKIKKEVWVILTLVLLIFFRFWNLTSNDLFSDDALYSFRALGWLDYLGSGQTTPIQWFDQVPGWANLSFHDAPPLVFAIQHLFFNFFGPNVLAARLPFGLAGVGALILFYFLLKRFKGERFALLATFILVISSFAAWAGRVGYLEGVEVFFIVLSLFFFSWYIASNHPCHLWYFAAAMALAILCKYTAIFLVPAVIFYLLIWRRGIFKKKYFWLSVVIFLVVLSPIIIYNVKVFQYRGHFDAALSSMIGLHPEDFKAISSRGLSFDIGRNLLSFWDTLLGTNSLPLAILIMVSLFYLGFKIIKRRSGNLENIFGINILMVIVMFMFLGFGPKFFSIAVPFLLFAVAILIFDSYFYLKNKKAIFSKLFLIVLILMASWEIFYNFNTNIISNPIGSSPWLYSASRFYNYGFNQLDDYLQNKIIKNLPSQKRVVNFNEFSLDPADLQDRDIIFFDDTINWFAYSWYLQKYIYYRWPVISFSNYLKTIPFRVSDPIDSLKQAGVTGFYYIYVVDERVVDPVKKTMPAVMDSMKKFADNLDRADIKPQEIKNNQGVTAFKIYYFKF